MQHYRDRRNWHKEFKFSDVTARTTPLYQGLVDTALAIDDLMIRAFVADRRAADPVERFGNQWSAYGRMAEQLVIGAIAYDEVTSVLADNYSTPRDVTFEDDLKRHVNSRLNRLAVTSVVRLDSRSSDGLQIVDLFTSAIAFEFRASAGLANEDSAKGRLAAYVRSALGCESFIGGWEQYPHNVRVYSHGQWPGGSQTEKIAL